MKRAVVAWVVVALGVVAFAQQTTPPPLPQTPPADAPQFRASIDVVRLDVSVLDKDRRPVRGLAAADFTIIENGTPQAITAFSPVDIPPPAARPSGWMRDVPPDVRGNVDVPQRRLFVLAIDDATIENNPFAIKAVKEIAHSVIDKLGPDDLMSVVFTRDNRNAQDFTDDRARLLRAADSFTVGFRGMGASGLPGVAVGAGGGGGGGMATAGGMGASSGESDDMWYLYSVGVLERAVEFLSDVAERRKAIIYVGQGLPFNLNEAAAPVNANKEQVSGAVSNAALQQRIKDQLNDVFERAQRANVNVYTIDACGLRTPAPPPLPPGSRVVAKPTCITGNEVDYLIDVAKSTGGRPIVNTSNFEPELTEVFQENASYYLLGYQPANAAHDGKFRKLEVRVNRKDVEVRSRSGYDAPRDMPTDRPKAAAAPVTKAIASIVPKGDLPMQLTVAPFAAANKLGAAVAVAVGLRQPIRTAAERSVESVDLRIAAYDADGRSFGNTKAHADVTIRGGASGAAEYEVFGQIELKPGRYQLRVAAAVASLDTAGSVYFDVDVPDFASEPLSMSGLIISAAPSPVFAPKEALKMLMPVIPTTRRVFGTAHKVSAYARVYQGGKAKLVPVSAHITVRNEKDAVVKDQQQPLAADKFGSTRAADLQFDVPTADLPSGHYVLTVEIPLGTTTARRDVRFQVVK